MNNVPDEKPLDLQRAEHALAAIDALKDKDYGHYVSYVKGLPATILQNGLGQALAGLLAKGDVPHKTLHDHLQAWLCRGDEDAPYCGKEKVVNAITQGTEDAYLHAHAEALAYLIWLKKFAVAFLKQPDSEKQS